MRKTVRGQGISKERLEASRFMAIWDRALSPDSRIGSDGIQRIIVRRPQRLELDQIAFQFWLILEVRHAYR